MIRYSRFLGSAVAVAAAVYVARKLILLSPPVASLREPITDYRAEVARFGEALGVPVPEERIEPLLEMVARDSKDLFGSKKAAMRFLSGPSMDGGLTAREILELHALSPVLRRIDGLRFGVFA